MAALRRGYVNNLKFSVVAASAKASGVLQTFGAVVVMVELSVLRLPLPADQVVRQVAVGKGRGAPVHDQLGGGVGIRTRVFGHRRHCSRVM